MARAEDATPTGAGPTPLTGEQQTLFGADEAGNDEQVGYRGPTACAVAGITYRQLDYWARTELVQPTVRPAHGSGTQRLYSFRDILVLKIVKKLLDSGVSLPNIRVAVDHLRRRGVADLTGMTLMSDGTTIYEMRSAEDVIDLLQEGQGVFAIAVGPVMQEVEGTLAPLRAEPAERGEDAADADELAARRRRRTSA